MNQRKTKAERKIVISINDTTSCDLEFIDKKLCEIISELSQKKCNYPCLDITHDSTDLYINRLKIPQLQKDSIWNELKKTLQDYNIPFIVV